MSRLSLLKNGLAVFALLILIFFLYFWRLGTLTHGLSANEAAARTSSSSLHAIINDPVYGPHKILQFVSQKIFGHGAADIRVISAVSAVFFLVCFYQLARAWFGRMVGFFAALFLAATPWFVLIARNGAPYILLLAPLAVLAAYYWLLRSRGTLSFYTLLITSALSLYVPGMFWLVLVGLAISRRDLTELGSAIKKTSKLFALMLGVLIIVPLVYASVKDLDVIKRLLLVPSDWPSALVAIKSIAWSLLALVWRTPTHADFIIGRLPMLNIAQVALAAIGGFALLRLARNKMYLLAGLAAVGIFAASIDRNLAILSLALPAYAVAVAAGLRYLYMAWKNIFPRNPVPKYLAIVLIAALTVIHVSYGLRYSLSAWPNTTATRSTYIQK